MPNRDRTGPRGKGKKTGRGLGDCDSKDNSKRGRSSGRGKNSGGWGRNRRSK